MGISYKRLVEECRKDSVESVGRQLRENIRAKKIRTSDFDELGALFVECFGASDYYACKRGQQTFHDTLSRRLAEADGAVTTAAFQNIGGQIVYSALMDKYESPEFVFAKLIPETKALILDGEKMAGITNLGDAGAVRKEGDPYAIVGVGEDWIFTPAISDRGFEVPVTWEAVFNDRTGLLIERCGDVGWSIGYGEEISAINCVVDENTTAHRYNWRQLGPIATYGDNSGNHTWDNLAATNTLVDWTSLNTVEQLFNQMLDPWTGIPIAIMPKHLVVTKQNEQTARRIVSATEIRVITPGYATSGNPTQTNMPNPYNNKYEVVTSPYVAPQTATDTDWFLGDIGKYAKRMVAEPLNVVQAPSNNEAEFSRRIVSRFRANKRYAHVAVQPRAMCKSTVS